MRTMLLALLMILLLAGSALAHGGRWQGPPGSPPRRQPLDPIPPPVNPTPPSPPPSKTTPVPEPEKRPLPPVPETPRPDGPERPTSPAGRAAGSSPGLSHWTYWWNLNRETLLQLRRLQAERLKARTRTEGRVFLGRGKGGRPEDEGARKAREAIVDALMAAAKDRSEDVATGAILALGKSGDPRATSLLMELARNERAHGTVQESAALALGLAGSKSAEVCSFLSKLAADRRRADRTRAFALLGLGYLGYPGAVPTLISTARRADVRRDVSTAAILGAGILGDEIVVPDLSRWLAGRPADRLQDESLRAHSGAALGAIGSRSALPALARALRDRDRNVRRQTVLSLGALATAEDEAILKALLHHLGNDRDSLVRAFAAVALGETGAAIAGDPLLHAYRKGESAIVPYAAIGMALLARRSGNVTVAEKIVPTLRGQFADRGNQDLRGALAIALGIVRDEKAVPPLLKVLDKDGSPALRAHVALALGLIGDGRAIPALRAALESRSSPDVQREAAIALGLLGDREAVTILDRLVRNGRTEYVRGSAALALGRLATPKTAESLRTCLVNSSNPALTRAFVAVALGLVLDEAPAPRLSRIGSHLNHVMATPALVEILTLL